MGHADRAEVAAPPPLCPPLSQIDAEKAARRQEEADRRSRVLVR